MFRLYETSAKLVFAFGFNSCLGKHIYQDTIRLQTTEQIRLQTTEITEILQIENKIVEKFVRLGAILNKKKGGGV